MRAAETAAETAGVDGARQRVAPRKWRRASRQSSLWREAASCEAADEATPSGAPPTRAARPRPKRPRPRRTITCANQCSRC